MTNDAGPSRRPSQGDPMHLHHRSHRRKASLCAANAHNLMDLSDGVSNLEIPGSPNSPTLGGWSETTHIVPTPPPVPSAPGSPVISGRRATLASISYFSNGSSSPKANGSQSPTGTIRGGGPSSSTANGTYHPRSPPDSLGRAASKALNQSPSHSYLPSRGRDQEMSSTSSPKPPPSYQIPPLPLSIKRAAPPPPLPTPTAFASLMLLDNDRIRVVGFPPACQELFRRVLNKGWPGVEEKSRSQAPDVSEWKLAKKPWIADAPLASYRLIEYILFSLSREGWGLAMSAGMPGKNNTRDIFFFQPTPRRERVFFSVIFGTHMVTLLDAPDQRVCEAFVQAIGTWPAGAGALYSREHGAFAINMKRLGSGDTAWPTTGGKYEHALPQLMCAVLQHMAHVGYECVTTYDILDRARGWHWNDAKGIVNGAMPAIDVWVFASL